MTANVTVLGADGYLTTPEDIRNMVSGIWPRSSGQLTKDSFLCTPSDPGAGFALNRAAGKYVLQGSTTSAQGAYFVWDDGDEDIAWPTADATLPRVDTLVMLVVDAQYGAPDLSQGVHFIVVTGTPNASPVAVDDATIIADHAQPGAWARVCDVTIPAGATTILVGNIAMKLAQFASNRTVALVRKSNIAAVWPANGSHINLETLIGGGTAGQPVTEQMKKTFTLWSGRMYKIEVDISIVDGNASASPGLNGARVIVRYASGSTVTTSSTQIYQQNIIIVADDPNSNGGVNFRTYLPVGLASGTYTVGVFIECPGVADVRLLSPWYFSISDVGPDITEG